MPTEGFAQAGDLGELRPETVLPVAPVLDELLDRPLHQS